MALKWVARLHLRVLRMVLCRALQGRMIKYGVSACSLSQVRSAEPLQPPFSPYAPRPSLNENFVTRRSTAKGGGFNRTAVI